MSHERSHRGPTTDTSPVPFEKLPPEQQAIISDVNARLTEMHEDARVHDAPRAPSKTYPWPRVIEERTNRNIVLNGQRGTGKTSLMLTLLLGWQRDAQRTAERREIERRLFEGMGQRVRTLLPLDFNPLPEHLHPYTLFVQAFKPLVEALDSGQARAQGPWAPCEREPTIGEQWRQLHRSAELGWQGSRGSSRDIDQHAFDSLEQDTEWILLDQRWTAFVDRLTKTLEDRGLMPPGCLLVLPVDDLDLHPSMSDDLLLAVRRIWHRRVVVLLTGDLQHLEEAVGRKLMTRAFQESSFIQQPHDREIRKLKRLAKDLVNKALPPRERLSVPLWSLAEAWRLVHAPEDPIVALRAPAPALGDAQGDQDDRLLIADFLDGRLKVRPEPVIRVRDAAQIFASDALETLQELMRVCRDEHGNPMLTKTAHSRWRWNALLPNQTLHVWTTYSDYTSTAALTPDAPIHRAEHRAEHTAGSKGGLVGRVVTYHTKEVSTRDDVDLFATDNSSISGSISNISPLTLVPDLLSTLLFLEDHGHIDGIIREDSQSSFKEGVSCRLTSNITLKFPLPTPMSMTSGLDHRKLAKEWNERVPMSAKGDWDSTLWLWIWFFLKEPLEALGVEDRDAFLERPRITPELWSSLLERLTLQARHPLGFEPVGLARWALRAIPVMAAPEYGLSREMQQRLLDWRREISGEVSWPSVCKELEYERRLALRRSIHFFSSFTDDQLARTGSLQDTSTYDGILAAIESEIYSEHPDAVWWSKETKKAPIETFASNDLLDIEVSPTRPVVNILYNTRISLPSEERRTLGEIFHVRVIGGYRETNWATIQASQLLRTASNRRQFIDVVLKTEGILSPADFMVQAWQLLTEMTDSPATTREMKGWVTSDVRTLSYDGPDLLVAPTARQHIETYRFSAQTYSEWSLASTDADLNPSERDHMSLLGWLLLCHSYPERSESFQRIEVRVPSVLSFNGTALLQPRYEKWREQEGVRHAWRRICSLARQRYATTPKGQQLPQEQWLLSSWLLMNFETMALGGPATLLAYPLNPTELQETMDAMRREAAKPKTDMGRYVAATDWLGTIEIKVTREVFSLAIVQLWAEYGLMMPAIDTTSDHSS